MQSRGVAPPTEDTRKDLAKKLKGGPEDLLLPRCRPVGHGAGVDRDALYRALSSAASTTAPGPSGLRFSHLQGFRVHPQAMFYLGVISDRIAGGDLLEADANRHVDTLLHEDPVFLELMTYPPVIDYVRGLFNPDGTPPSVHPQSLSPSPCMCKMLTCWPPLGSEVLGERSDDRGLPRGARQHGRRRGSQACHQSTLLGKAAGGI